MAKLLKDDMTTQYFSIIKQQNDWLSTTRLQDDAEQTRHHYSKSHYTDHPIATFSYDPKTDEIKQVWSKYKAGETETQQ